MHAYTTEMLADLPNTCGQKRLIGIRTEIESIDLDIQYAVPCGIILNELVINAYKHAFPDGRRGEISVALREPVPKLYRLSVRDNGTGIKDDIVKSAGVRRKESLGMTLIGVLVDQMSRTLTYQTVGGSLFEIEWSDSVSRTGKSAGLTEAL